MKAGVRVYVEGMKEVGDADMPFNYIERLGHGLYLCIGI